jgi:hypothetical protein
MYCTKCGEPLKLGEFAYNQEICWDCFEKRVMEIIDLPELYTEDKEIIKHLLATTKEIHRRRSFR